MTVRWWCRFSHSSATVSQDCLALVLLVLCRSLVIADDGWTDLSSALVSSLLQALNVAQYSCTPTWYLKKNGFARVYRLLFHIFSCRKETPSSSFQLLHQNHVSTERWKGFARQPLKASCGEKYGSSDCWLRQDFKWYLKLILSIDLTRLLAA